MKKWFKKNGVELVLGIGLSLFLINFFTEQDEGMYILSIPLAVIGLIKLYQRHYRSAYSASVYFSEDEDDDDLYEDAKEAVMEAGKASTSYLQRRLRIGYSRSARLIDTLEENGIIGPANGSEPRTVIKKESQ